MGIEGTGNFPNGATCGSEPARDGLKNTAIILQSRVIVDDHREQARSHKE
jgi:hypothetical protein